MLIGICGFAQVGKDTVARHLVDAHGYVHGSFAWRLRQLAWEVNPFLPDGRRWRAVHTEYGYERCKAEVDGYRQFLKDLGNGARKVLGEQVWVDAALTGDLSRRVISDVRFTNEADAIAKRGGKVIRIERPGYKAESSFEEEVPFILADAIVQNDGSIEDLNRKVDKALAALSQPPSLRGQQVLF